MTLNSSGPISLAGATAGQSIAVELGLSSTGTISLNQANVRTLAGVPSGAIVMPTNFYGKSNTFTYTMTSSTANGNLRSLVVAAGWGGTSAVVANINSGVYAYATNTGTPGLTINGSWPGGVTLNNSGNITGMGGDGGRWNVGGGPGGLGLSVSSPVSINNINTISGGGGGGGGGTGRATGSDEAGGGGGGGGRTGLTNSAGGAGEPLSPYWCCGPVRGWSGSPGGAGTSGGAGGGGPGGVGVGVTGLPGGPGGGWGASGSAGSGVYGGPGGAGGAATSGSGPYITWIATGTRNGTIG